jgi:hypothetical protein
MLKISTILEKTEWNRYDHVNKTYKHETSYFKSGMVQSWNKFCFTGGIVEVDVIFPGEPFIGGLWPAVWMLGNLGRATYESSTNNIWPWSYNKCNRKLQQAQSISACNAQNHFGMHPFQGRGATEIDIVEVMAGDSNGPLPSTDPPISIPYADMTLQVAPGVPKNRPQSGGLPLRKNTVSPNGHTEFLAQTWYDNLTMHGNTSINPFFYGTYLAETKPYEPVTRTKKQAFQADAIGALHQLTPAHFNRVHTFRLEWQPGPGGRIDWFSKGHKINATFSMEGDGKGQDWVHAYELRDKSLSDLMGSQVPAEPTYLIFNTAVSSTWGFPYDTPDWCTKCFDCDDPKCACAFSPGFCQMLRQGDTAFYIDSIRVYQSKDHKAHVGSKHTLGCDPPDYPTKDYIRGHEYRYMRNPPFSYEDKHPLRPIQKGGAECFSDKDCGSHVQHENLTEVYMNSYSTSDGASTSNATEGRGKCVKRSASQKWFGSETFLNVCQCNPGFTGPRCMVIDHIDESISAHDIRMSGSPFQEFELLYLTPFMIFIVGVMAPALMAILIFTVIRKKKQAKTNPHFYQKPRTTFNNVAPPGRGAGFVVAESVPLATAKNDHLSITGRSV